MENFRRWRDAWRRRTATVYITDRDNSTQTDNSGDNEPMPIIAPPARLNSTERGTIEAMSEMYREHLLHQFQGLTGDLDTLQNMVNIYEEGLQGNPISQRNITPEQLRYYTNRRNLREYREGRRTLNISNDERDNNEGFKTGGRVKKTGRALVHKDEFVLPKGVKATKKQKQQVTKIKRSKLNKA